MGNDNSSGSGERRKPGILVVEDDPVFSHVLRDFLLKKEVRPYVAASPGAALAICAKVPLSLALVDIHLAGSSGFDLLREMRHRGIKVPVIMMTASREVTSAIEALRLGAADYVLKPVDLEELWRKNQRYIQACMGALPPQEEEGLWRGLGLIGRSAAIRQVRRQIEKAAVTDMNVLISGESGTGKELCAAAIHQLSARGEQCFVRVNCGALGESVFHAEMFGHAKGSFTGADASRPGYIAFAEGGTLFMDEVGEIPLAVQASLLRAIELREYNAVGDTRARFADVRYLAATNRDLASESSRGGFRQDLFYRLSVLEIALPPLRERREDIPDLVELFVGKQPVPSGGKSKRVSPQLLGMMMEYDWPGNVRQLQNLLARACAFAENEVLQPSDFSKLLPPSAARAVMRPAAAAAKSRRSVLGAAELANAIEEAKGDVGLAAGLLRISRATIYRKIKLHAIDLNRFKPL